MTTFDKCNICGWSGPSDYTATIYGTWECPTCGSEDLEDINENPYEEDEGDWGEMI